MSIPTPPSFPHGPRSSSGPGVGPPPPPITPRRKKKKGNMWKGVILGIGVFLILGTVITLSIIYVIKYIRDNTHFEYYSQHFDYADDEELVELPEEYHPVVQLETQAIVSDHLAPQGGNTYGAENLTDGNQKTAWAVNCKFTSDGTPIDMLKFNMDARNIDHIMIVNGYAKSREAFRNNARARYVYISRVPWDEALSSDILYEGPLEDSMEQQFLEVSPNYDNSIPTREIYVRFGSDVIHGEKDLNDFCISEIQFYGY